MALSLSFSLSLSPFRDVCVYKQDHWSVVEIEVNNFRVPEQDEGAEVDEGDLVNFGTLVYFDKGAIECQAISGEPVFLG